MKNSYTAPCDTVIDIHYSSEKKQFRDLEELFTSTNALSISLNSVYDDRDDDKISKPWISVETKGKVTDSVLLALAWSKCRAITQCQRYSVGSWRKEPWNIFLTDEFQVKFLARDCEGEG